jgi:hypothetical protein
VRVSCNCRMVVIFGFGPGGPGDQGEVAPRVCPNCHNKVFLHHVRSKKSARQAPNWASRATRLPRRTAAARQGSRATARDADDRAGSAVAERPDEIPAAAGTALTGRALTSFDPDGIRDPPVCPAGRRLRPCQAGPAGQHRARVDDLGRRRADQTGGPMTRASGKGRGHAVSEWRPERRNNDPAVRPATSDRSRRGGARLAAVAGRWAVVAAAGGS